jgi:hypothetical protein
VAVEDAAVVVEEAVVVDDVANRSGAHAFEERING